jgi:hypothetical protein
MKHPNVPNGNQIRDLPAVSQQTTPLPTPNLNFSAKRFAVFQYLK